MDFDKIKVFQTFEMFDHLRIEYSNVASQLELNTDEISHDWAKVLRSIASDYNNQRTLVRQFIDKKNLTDEFISFNTRQPINTTETE